MRVLRIYLCSLALLAIPKGVLGEQEVKADHQKTVVRSEAKSTTAPPAENWGALDDIKTGLQASAIVVVQRDEMTNFVRELVRVEWRRGDRFDLWITRPKVTGKVPVILYLYNYLDAGDRFRDDRWSKRASDDGFAAVGFTSALSTNRYHDRPMKQWFVSELQESLGSSVHDVQLILNFLAARGDMDMEHVGMFGMGSGATIAILAAHVDSRIKALDLLDPWGDWPEWLRSSPVVPDTERAKYLTPEFLKSVAALDPIEYLPVLKTPSFRLQLTLSDPATPDIAKQRLAKSVPDQTRLVKYTTIEDLVKAWRISGLTGWIKGQMRSQMPKESVIRAEEASRNAR